MLNVRMWHAPSSFFTRVLVAVSALLVLVGTGGCDGLFSLENEESTKFSVEVAYEAIESGGVDVEQIDGGKYGDIVEGTRKVLRDEEAYASFWKQLYADREPTPTRPEVDFDRQVVVAIVLGERPTGGYGVEVDGVLASENGERIQVRYTEGVPGEECGVTQALTSPFVLVAVEAQDAEFGFSRSEETRSC